MIPERWQKVKDLFESASGQAPAERAAFLDAACADDPELRREVESLLACDEEPASLLDAPAVEVAAELLTRAGGAPMRGRRIGPYKVLREIGHGGMGAVYLAERADEVYHKQVAIKLVRRGMDSEGILRRFHRERQILANLDHPNVARLLDGGTTEDGLSYFVMEYVDGLPIDMYCDQHKLTTVERLKLFRTVCSAVRYAHEHHIVHRDLKPSNILVTADGAPKLLDFGIAKLLDPEFACGTSGTTAAALRPMTPEYASPEQARGLSVTPASDVYSLGVLLYELLTGHRPYRLPNGTPQEIERVICEEKPQKPSTAISRVEEVPSPGDATPITITPESVSRTRDGPPEKLRRRLAGDLDNIVLMALRKEPERRYSSVEQFSEDIRRHLEGLPVLARKDTLWYRSIKFIKRNKTGVLAATLSAVIVLAFVVGFYLLAQRERAADKAIDSIAILPLVNASADPNMEYLSDGITESLISILSQLPKLKVMSHSAVFRYKGREMDPQAVGRELKVRVVLTGRILQRGDGLAISLELVNARDNSRIWGQQYHRKLADVLLVQEEISKEISEKLHLKLSGKEQNLLTKHYTENTEAYQAYLKGRYWWSKRTEEPFKKGIAYFNQAIEKDPAYALAYSGLADSYTMSSVYGYLVPKEAFPKAKEAATKALQIDDQLSEAHTSLAAIMFWYDWDWSGAEREFRRAIQLNPNYVTAHQWYSHYLMWMGRHDESFKEHKQQQELDPSLLVANMPIVLNLYFSRQYDQAIEQARKVIEIDRSGFLPYYHLGTSYREKGLYEQAIAVFKEGLKLYPDHPQYLAQLGYTYAVAGNREATQQILDQLLELSQRRYVSPYDIAGIYAGLGDRDQAFEWFEKAYKERAIHITFLKVDPRLDPIRSDPRFTDLLRRIGLPP